MSILPEVDAFTGVVTQRRYDHNTQTLHIKREQDCRELIDLNKAQRDENDQSWRKKEDRMMHFARIPDVFIEKWLREDGFNVYAAKMDRHGRPNDDMVRLLRKLEDPDYKWLKTTNMRMG